jgi:ubiquitin-like 1-activating enzyme E1 A
MSNARVLYINLTGVTCEIMKNLVLAGVAAVVCDSRPYPEAVREMPCSFFHAEDMESAASEIGSSQCTVAKSVQPKVEELNPLLAGRNSIEERPIAELSDEFFTQFDAIVASRLTVEEAKRISTSLQKVEEGKLFIVTDTFGFDGCAHLDFGANHKFRRELGKDKLSDLMSVEPYLSMADMMSISLEGAKGRWDKSVPRILVLHRLLMDYWRLGDKPEFAKYAQDWLAISKLSPSVLASDVQDSSLDALAEIAQHPEVSPVCAVLGGILGNEVIKSLTGKGEPANNVMLFSGFDGGCRSFLLTKNEA